jgi:hypothetical protein
MYNITLICTRHDEKGLCNVNELYKIFEAVNPEVIFEELTTSQFNEYYKDSIKEENIFSSFINYYQIHKNKRLETDTIKYYLQTHQINHIPVDYFEELPPTFLDENKNMHIYIEKVCPNYNYFIDLNSIYAEQYGFKYLNSDNCININKKLYEEIGNLLKLLNNDKYIQTHNFWNDLMDKRENEMLKNIYNYCKENQFNKGLFYIGSGHRESIINKIKIYNEKEEIKINWNYNNYENIL